MDILAHLSRYIHCYRSFYSQSRFHMVCARLFCGVNSVAVRRRRHDSNRVGSCDQCGFCVILIIIFKPFDKWKKRQAQATNSDRVVGQKALVVGKIDDLQGTGLVKVMGQMWSAASVDGSTIEEGVYVNVIKISGVKLIVEKID